jgi:hypothetical protein
MFFLDPQHGRRRRHIARDKVNSQLRRKVHDVERATRYEQGILAGEQARSSGAGVFHPVTPVDLREHLRGEIHSHGVTDVNVDVDDDWRVTLRGQVDAMRHADVLALAAATDGVSELIDLTHRPGEPAPNKADSIAASASLPHSGANVIKQ